MNYFITGTDTAVGKTYVTCLLLRALNALGKRAVGFKPICCGDRSDVVALRAAGGADLSMDEINPVWFRTGVSPFAADLIEHRGCDIPLIVESLAGLSARCDTVLVEGAGGWEVPIQRDYFVGDLAAHLALPVLVVVNNRLGALNHTVLTVNAIRARGLTCAGLLLNEVGAGGDPARTSNRRVLEEIIDVPILAEVRHGQDHAAIMSLAARLETLAA